MFRVWSGEGEGLSCESLSTSPISRFPSPNEPIWQCTQALHYSLVRMPGTKGLLPHLPSTIAQLPLTTQGRPATTPNINPRPNGISPPMTIAGVATPVSITRRHYIVTHRPGLPPSTWTQDAGTTASRSVCNALCLSRHFSWHMVLVWCQSLSKIAAVWTNIALKSVVIPPWLHWLF